MKKLFTLASIIAFLFFFAVNSKASSLIDVQTMKKIESLAKTKQWQKLLYFEGKRSNVDNPKFFLSDIKKVSPLSEAVSAYKEMFLKSEKIDNEHAVCKFPARFMILAENLEKLDQFSKLGKCPKLSAFMKRMTGKSVSLIFSSYYLNNPSSAFGHTFLKINRSETTDLDLLNYGINYAATVSKENPVFYALKGLMGFFKGEFTAVPYYYKVREYNDFESRDLWEYKLNLTPKEVALLHLHIWELGRGWSKYYFLSGNCSYWAIKVLEAIKPNYNLSDHYGSKFVIPAETIKSLYAYADLVKEVKYRPSLRKQLLTKLNKLNNDETNNIRNIVDKIETQTIVEKELLNEKPETLETSILLFDYLNAADYVGKEKELFAKKKILLEARSQLPLTSSPEVKIDFKNAPHNSHPPRRIDLGFLSNNYSDKNAYRMAYKQGYHELQDSRTGFNPHMALNFLDFSVLVSEDTKGKSKLELEHFYAINIDAFTPVTKLDQQFSWRLNFGLDSERFLRTVENKVGFVNFDSGLSMDFLRSKSLLLYFLISNTVEFNGRFENGLRLSLAPLLGFKLSLGRDTNLISEVRSAWFTDLSGDVLNSIQVDTKFQTYIPRIQSAVYFSNTYIHSEKSSDHHLTSAGLRYFF